MFKANRFFIALRYSQSKSKSGFVSFITFFSVAGIGLGVMALIIVLSVMNGFESELKNRILGVIPHVVVEQNNKNPAIDMTSLAAIPDVMGITPFIQTSGLVQSSSQMKAISVQGVDPDSAQPLSLIAKNIQVGDFMALQPGAYQLVLGRQLATRLNVRVGDKVRIMLAEKSVFTPMGRMPVQRKFMVAGIFDAGSDVDASVALVNVYDLNKMLRQPIGEISTHRVYLENAFLVDKVVQQISAQNADLKIVDWRQTQGQLFQAVKMEKNIMWLMLALIIAVATFNIVSALVMLVNDKKAEIASLKTMGMTDKDIVSIFIFQGMYKGVGGAVVGTIFGLLLCIYLNDLMQLMGIHIMVNPAYEASGLPVVIEANQVVLTSLSAIVMSFLATIYPAYTAAKMQPAEILKHE
ncbi:LolC/E family lipoprotein releasing system, transmembrane protein [Catenovulum agarivorans DS-2]|uniref:LolC/E family lipoprotein releasing system, transmembrane protein n=1 Tax=Catenovulum agarivorans DS-2 TaxID=1328313 RepID=W7QHQ3_9ALTE|nr:LolC/E family lipoprotein releasing system, transmembrane protein [Catenovulum agarivorans DS-2]